MSLDFFCKCKQHLQGRGQKPTKAMHTCGSNQTTRFIYNSFRTPSIHGPQIHRSPNINLHSILKTATTRLSTVPALTRSVPSDCASTIFGMQDVPPTFLQTDRLKWIQGPSPTVRNCESLVKRWLILQRIGISKKTFMAFPQLESHLIPLLWHWCRTHALNWQHIND